MKLDLEQIKALAEAGDVSALEQHILTNALERGDLSAAIKANASIQKEYESERDKHHSKALETWKDNHLEALVDAEVQKRNPEKTPEQLEIEKLKQQFAESEAARKRIEQKNAAIEKLTTEGVEIPSKLIDKLVSDDETATAQAIADYIETAQTIKSAAVESVYRENGLNPDRGGAAGGKDDFARELAKDNFTDTSAQKAADYYFNK